MVGGSTFKTVKQSAPPVWTTDKVNKLSIDWLYTHTIPLQKVNLVYRICTDHGVIDDRLLYNL
jgi:acyl CoA:acetate/3-ketoacid CoA transferase beta subunit